MMSLLDQLNSAAAKELAGYQPVSDNSNRSVLDLLDEIDEEAECLGRNSEEWRELAVQISFLVCMVRVKLGFPASIHMTDSPNREAS